MANSVSATGLPQDRCLVADRSGTDLALMSL